jgi:hypothetical protein
MTQKYYQEKIEIYIITFNFKKFTTYIFYYHKYIKAK